MNGRMEGLTKRTMEMLGTRGRVGGRIVESL